MREWVIRSWLVGEGWRVSLAILALAVAALSLGQGQYDVSTGQLVVALMWLAQALFFGRCASYRRASAPVR